MDYAMPIHVSAIHCTEPQSLTATDYLLIFTLTDGVFLRDETEIALPKGSLVFLAPFSSRRIILTPCSDALFARISAAFLESMMGIPKNAAIVRLQEMDDTICEKLIILFDLFYNQPETDQLKIGCIAYEMLLALRPIITNHVRAEGLKEPRNQRLAKFLEENFKNPLSLGDLAKAFFVSRQHMSMLFHREMGTSFSEYLTGLRLNEAQRLLLTTNMNITGIASESGFPSLKSLNQAFVEKFGMSPRAYRKQMNSEQAVLSEPPSGIILRDINQLLRPYRLVYQKQKDTIYKTDAFSVNMAQPMEPHWDILNVDNCQECLHIANQEALSQLQQRLHFRYVRLENAISTEVIPSIPTGEKYRFTYFFRLMDFFRKIGLIPMLVLGDNCEISTDYVLRESAYTVSAEAWLKLLREMLDASVQRWGREWVDSWRFEFHMPEQSLCDEADFVELYSISAALIRSFLPHAPIGGPALSISADEMPRWQKWFQLIQDRQLPVNFISLEMWADCTYAVEQFRGDGHTCKAIYRLESVRGADIELQIERIKSIRNMMQCYGLTDARLFVSALGVTKYQATAAQVGGHCAAYLVECNLLLNELVDGIGCWKALNAEAEYPDENQLISRGCGMLSRYDLKNINYYAFVFLSGLLPFELYRSSNALSTTDMNDNYTILIHNCKNYDSYFYRHYLAREGIEFADSRHYCDNSALEQKIIITGVSRSNYLVKQYLIGDHHGDIAATLTQLGEARILDETEIEYVAGQSLPYLHAFRLEASGQLEFQVTLQPNEVMLLTITPSGRTFYDIKE